jgi:hypothetical protein
MNKVKLEMWLPGSATVKVSEDIIFRSFQLPRIWKMFLSEASEIEIFGDLSPYRNPWHPMPWGNEQYFEKKFAEIDEEQVEIYNTRMRKRYHEKPDILAKKEIKAGVVVVFRASHDVHLKNVEYFTEEQKCSNG